MSNFENEKLTLILPAALAEKIHAALLLLIEKEETLVNQSNDAKAIDLVEEFMEVQSLIIEQALPPAVLQLKGNIKELITKDVEIALQTFKEKLRTNTRTFDDVIRLLGRYNRIQQTFQKGLISFPSAHREFIKIENAIIYIVNNIREAELK